MAMKVTKTAINRLGVDMSCGCRMYAEFADAQCKKPLGHPTPVLRIVPDSPDEVSPDEEVEAFAFDRTFVPCDKHEKDTAVSMLEFIIGERLDEAVEQAQKAPVTRENLYDLPQTVSSDGTLAGESVSTVAKVNRPKAVQSRERPADPSEIKTRTRTPTELRASGAIMGNSPLAEMQIDEVDEDEVITDNLEDLFASVGGDPEV
jgi:hypothetical protein